MSNASRTLRASSRTDVVFLMAAGYRRAISSWLKVRVEIIGDTHLETIKVDIDEEPIAVGLDARKRRLEQVGQRRPVEPVRATAVCTKEGRAAALA